MNVVDIIPQNIILKINPPRFLYTNINLVVSDILYIFARMTDNLKHKIIQYLNSKFSNLEQFKSKKYPGYIFFMKDGKVIFDYNKKNGFVFISYDKIWSFLESFFGLEYEEIQPLTKEWVEEHFKLRVRTIYDNSQVRTVRWRDIPNYHIED